MERYIKSISIRSSNGSVIMPPLCCLHCKNQTCEIPCDKYETMMKGVTCSSFDIEWTTHTCWYQELSTVLLVLLFTGGCVLGGWLAMRTPDCHQAEICASRDMRLKRSSLLISSCGDTNILGQIEKSYLKIKGQEK